MWLQKNSAQEKKERGPKTKIIDNQEKESEIEVESTNENIPTHSWNTELWKAGEGVQLQVTIPEKKTSIKLFTETGSHVS